MMRNAFMSYPFSNGPGLAFTQSRASLRRVLPRPTLRHRRMRRMDGLMMDFPLTLTHLLKRAEQFFPHGEIVTRMPDKSFHRTTYGETMRRSRQLAVALKKAGLERGDRVA